MEPDFDVGKVVCLCTGVNRRVKNVWSSSCHCWELMKTMGREIGSTSLI